jgi:hypothetical protein
VRFFNVPPNEERVVEARNDPNQFLCREDFVFDCVVNAFGSTSEFDCNNLLETVYRAP